jgi:hypothetical protein
VTIAVISFVMLAIGRRTFALCCATTEPSSPRTYQAAAETGGGTGAAESALEAWTGTASWARTATTASGALRISGATLYSTHRAQERAKIPEGVRCAAAALRLPFDELVRKIEICSRRFRSREDP